MRSFLKYTLLVYPCEPDDLSFSEDLWRQLVVCALCHRSFVARHTANLEQKQMCLKVDNAVIVEMANVAQFVSGDVDVNVKFAFGYSLYAIHVRYTVSYFRCHPNLTRRRRSSAGRS